jgi:hypothetical protein
MVVANDFYSHLGMGRLLVRHVPGAHHVREDALARLTVHRELSVEYFTDVDFYEKFEFEKFEEKFFVLKRRKTLTVVALGVVPVIVQMRPVGRLVHFVQV